LARSLDEFEIAQMMLALHDMDMTHGTRDDQDSLWNGPGGHAWVDEQELLDRLLKPFETLLIEAVAARSPKQLLDVGCGTGSTTLAAARLLGAQGRCIGVDISAPMIAAARARAERENSQARFICANVQDHAFDPASTDMIMSRFGVMFFDDPVRAFANLRRAATGDAEMCCIAWRSAEENPFMTAAERAAAPLLPNLPARRPDAPGQFAFGNRDRVHSILEQSGWAEIDMRPIDVACALPEKELVRYLTRLGPVGRILQEADAQTRARVVDAIRPAFDPYVHGDEIRVMAACWIISGAQADPAHRSPGLE
jgi:ubiquinone/menaquinone biosynthesis C-methylase UbiE